MTWTSRIYRFFEWVPLDSAGLIIAIASLLSREIEFSYQGHDIAFIITVGLVIILAILFVGKRLIPSIRAYTYDDHGNKIRLDDLDMLDASDGETEIELRFEVPDHHGEIYIHFDIDGYIVGVEQYTVVNFDTDKAITCYSDIHSFELTLKLVPDSSETNRGSVIPLRIVDKLHKRNICEMPVEG